MNIELIRFGQLQNKDFSLGPWAEKSSSALGVLRLLENNPYCTAETPVYASISSKGELAAYVYLYPDGINQTLDHRLQTTDLWGSGRGKTLDTRPWTLDQRDNREVEDPKSLKSNVQGLKSSLDGLRSVSHRWLWMTDFMSLPAYRNSGAGVFLIRELMALLHKEGYILGAIHMSGDSQKVFKALKFPVMTTIPRFLYLVNTRPLLQRVLPDRVAMFLSKPVNGLLWVRNTAYRRKLQSHGVVVKEQDSYIAWDNGDTTFDHSAAQIAWKRKIPGGTKSYQAYDLFEGNIQIGSCLLRKKYFTSIAGGRFRNVTVVSVMHVDGEPAHAVVAAVMSQAKRMAGVDVIEWCEDRVGFQKELQKAGFLVKGGLSFCASRELPGELHVSQGDGDAFF